MYVVIGAYDFTLLWPSVKWTRWTTYSGYSQRLPDAGASLLLDYYDGQLLAR